MNVEIAGSCAEAARQKGSIDPSAHAHSQITATIPYAFDHHHIDRMWMTHTRSMLGFNIDCFIPGVLFSDSCTDLSTAIRERQLRC